MTVDRNDPALKEKLDAVCARAQRQIDNLMGQLAELAELAASDPNNPDYARRVGEIFNEAQALSAELVAACGKDIMIESNRALEGHINGIKREQTCISCSI